MPSNSSPRGVFVCVTSLCLLGVLFVGVSAAGQPVVDAGTPLEIVSVDNTSGYLQPTGADEPRQAVVHQSVDVGTTIQSSATTLEGRLERLAVQRRFDATDGDLDELAVLREETGSLERRVENVSEAHLEARRGFSNGTLSADEVVRRLALLQATADREASVRQLLERRGSRLDVGDAQGIVTSLRNLEVTVETVSGPAADRLRQRVSGDRAPGATLVAATGDGLVVATVADGQFYRDALDPTHRSSGGTNQFATGEEDEISAAFGRAVELYPWAFDNGGGSASLEGYGDTPVYRISVSHSHGELQTYLDGVTENAFKEVQLKRVDAVPTTTLRTGGEGNLELVVNGTHATGPLAVTVRRATTGAPIDADVRIDGTIAGSTDEDGRLWTVQPTGQFTVNATTTGGSTVDVTIPA